MKRNKKTDCTSWEVSKEIFDVGIFNETKLYYVIDRADLDREIAYEPEIISKEEATKKKEISDLGNDIFIPAYNLDELSNLFRSILKEYKLIADVYFEIFGQDLRGWEIIHEAQEEDTDKLGTVLVEYRRRKVESWSKNTEN